MAVFGERGLSATVAEVADRAGVGNATVFRNFPTRADLLHEIARRWLDDWRQVVTARVDVDLTPETLHELIRGVFDRLRHDRLALDLLRGADLGDEVVAVRSEVERLFDVALARAVSDGLVRTDITYADLSLLILGMAGRLSETGVDDPEAWSRAAEFTWSAIRAL